MKPFLYSIAEAYLKHEAENLGDMCFVFPNKRSVTFFNHYLTAIIKKTSSAGNRPILHPHTTTITEFTESFSNGYASADRLEMVFILYDIYRKTVRNLVGVSEADKIDFNKFVYWADVLIQDFDDVDDAMADPYMIFRNVSSLKEISANYLTDDQIRIVQEFWKDFDLEPEVKEFWNHITYPEHTDNDTPSDSSERRSPRAGFLRLWQIMGQLYDGFRTELKKLGLHTPGMNSRHTAEKIKKLVAGELPFCRYVFVGFNNLSVAEHTIFRELADMRHPDTGISMADFYWDLGSPVFEDASIPGIGRVTRYEKEFPSRYDCVEKISGFPRINIIGVPSRIGQCKAVSSALSAIFPSQPDPIKLRRTAIVMPEESLLTSLVNSLPGNVTPLNITMGYKLKNTSVAGLIRNIVSLQMRAYKSKVTRTFFIDDVTRILTHPLIRAVDRRIASIMLTEIRTRRLFNVPEAFFQDKSFAKFSPLFTMVADKQSCRDVFDYLFALIEWLDKAITSSWNKTALLDNIEEEDYPEETVEQSGLARVAADSAIDRSTALQQAFLRRYSNAVIRLQKLRDRYLETQDGKLQVYMEDATVFNLVEKIIRNEMLNFDGMPLRGLQIMGVLEARALDFETLLIPSMNERIFPRSKSVTSFIPMVLRRAYRLSTSEDQEEAFAYMFYRMISRAKDIHLIYDARTTGLRNSQPSRFIHQLVHILRPANMTYKVLPYRLTGLPETRIAVEKTPEMMEKINRYKDADNPLYLSATAIERFLACPVSFYLERIAGFKPGDEINDWMDEGTYGTIVHQVFERLYNLERDKHGHNGEVLITSERLDEMINDNLAIDTEITRAVNQHYTRLGEDNDTPLSGDSLIIAQIMRMLVQATLKREKELTPYTYKAGEWDKKMQLSLTGSSGNEIKINFTCKIDRIDRLENHAMGLDHLRIVDYKTGADSISAKDVSSVLTDFKVKAFLQLMLYCQSYSQYTGYTDTIQPVIYPIRTIMVKKIEPLQWSAPAETENIENVDLKRPSRNGGKWNVLDYRDYKLEFNDLLIAELEKLFDPDTPFICPGNNDGCRYCKFLQICRREIPR